MRAWWRHHISGRTPQRDAEEALAELERRKAFALGRQDDVTRLRRRYEEYLEWAHMLAHVIHRPWTPRTARYDADRAALEELGGLPRDDAWVARLRDAYLEPWGPPTELHATFELAQRLGPFAHAFKELRVLDAIPEIDRPQFAPNLPDILAGCVAAAD